MLGRYSQETPRQLCVLAQRPRHSANVAASNEAMSPPAGAARQVILYCAFVPGTAYVVPSAVGHVTGPVPPPPYVELVSDGDDAPEEELEGMGGVS